MSYNIKHKSFKRKNPSNGGRLRRQNAYYTARTSGGTQSFVPRTFGNPNAITERKYFTTSYQNNLYALVNDWNGSITIPSTVQVPQVSTLVPTALTSPRKGTNYNNRVGSTIMAKKIMIKGTVTLPRLDQASSSDAVFVRIILVCDTQTNATYFTPSDVIGGEQDHIAFANPLMTLNKLQNPKQFGRYKVLKDLKINLNNPNINTSIPGTSFLSNAIVKSFKIKINLKNMPMRFNFDIDAEDITSNVDNSITLMAAYAPTGVQSAVPSITYVSRFYFGDP